MSRPSKTQARVERIFGDIGRGIRVPARAVKLVMSKGILLAVCGLSDGEIAAGMLQEAKDAANALSAAASAATG